MIRHVLTGAARGRFNMEPEAALQLAQACLPSFQSKGLDGVAAVESAKARNLLGLWTGMGSVDEVIVTGSGGVTRSFVAKSIGSYKELEGDELALVDHMSYYNEATFYESDIPDRMCAAGARCPRPLLVDRGSGEQEGVVTICMTKLEGGSFGRSGERARAALTWLARLHAMFWGGRADKAVAAGLAEHACFWSLVRRDIELGRMKPQDPLRLAASGIHARLMADKMQTMCHGDVKGANIMWDEGTGVAFYDFQWFGKAPPSKDLAYFIGINGGGDEKELLSHYHAELVKLLEAQGDEAPAFEYLWDSYCLAQADLCRWMTGGFAFGNTGLIFGHAKDLLRRLDGGTPLATEEEYRQKIFEAFPP